MPLSTERSAKRFSFVHGLLALALGLMTVSKSDGAAANPARPPFAVQQEEFATWPLPESWLKKEISRALPGPDLRARPLLVDAWGLPILEGALIGAQPFDPASARDAATGLLALPTLEGGVEQFLGADGELTLRFDRPVGNLGISSSLPFTVTPDASRKVFRLQAGAYAQGQTYPMRLNWQSVTGEVLPPLSLNVATPPALTVSANTQGINNLGLVLPLQLNFSEPLRDRIKAKQGVSVRTSDGGEVSGSWLWVGKQRLQFTPKPSWPASTQFEVRGEPSLLRAERGGRLEGPVIAHFGTGTDRKIYVYLDRQQATAVENGQVVRTFKVSTGKAKTPTSTGDFYIYDRYLRKTMRSRGIPKGRPGYYEVEDVPYTQFFKGDLALHGAFWHNGFGHPASHGCVNLATKEKNKRWPGAPEDAGWLYSWAALGVPVTIYREAPVEIAVK